MDSCCFAAIFAERGTGQECMADTYLPARTRHKAQARKRAKARREAPTPTRTGYARAHVEVVFVYYHERICKQSKGLA